MYIFKVNQNQSSTTNLWMWINVPQWWPQQQSWIPQSDCFHQASSHDRVWGRLQQGCTPASPIQCSHQNLISHGRTPGFSLSRSWEVLHHWEDDKRLIRPCLMSSSTHHLQHDSIGFQVATSELFERKNISPWTPLFGKKKMQENKQVIFSHPKIWLQQGTIMKWNYNKLLYLLLEKKKVGVCGDLVVAPKDCGSARLHLR